MVKKFI